MLVLTAILIGIVFACGIYLVLQRGFVRLFFGFGLLTHATNLFVLSMSGEPKDKASPIITAAANRFVDPLPQALILTAIVIGFGVSAYLVVMLYRLYLDTNTIDQKVMFDKKPKLKDKQSS